MKEPTFVKRHMSCCIALSPFFQALRALPCLGNNCWEGCFGMMALDATSTSVLSMFLCPMGRMAAVSKVRIINGLSLS